MIPRTSAALLLAGLAAACGGTTRFGDEDAANDTGGDSNVDMTTDTPDDDATGPDVVTDLPEDLDPDAVEDPVIDTPTDSTGDTEVDTGTDSPGDTAGDTIPDTAFDTAIDTVFDTAFDTAMDSTVDTAFDTAIDSVPDTGFDTVPDTGYDSGADTGLDTSIDVAPDAACTHEGCLLHGAGTSCCPGLTQVQDCEPPCTSTDRFCVDCGDGDCDMHETSWNCPADCPAGCDLADTGTAACSPIETWSCECIDDPCPPECVVTGSVGGEWRNSCTGAGYGVPCSDTTARPWCDFVGTWSEGWYTSGPDGGTLLIDWDFCAPRWECFVIW